MSLQFILGGSGSGKSHTLYKKIIDASMRSPKTRFLVIVPEQFTMQTQKDLVRLHPDGGILNIDILSFQRLAHRIFEEVGADRRIVLEETGKTLLLRRAATKEQDRLKILKGNLRKKGYLQQVKSMISELTQYDVDRDKMEKLLEAAAGRPQHFHRIGNVVPYTTENSTGGILFHKLKDISVLYDAFQRELEGKYITAEETLEALCQVADQSQILKSAVIALDGFTGFTPIQMKLMERLLTLAKEVFVTVTIGAGEDFMRPGSEHELFYLSKKTIHGLSRLAQACACEISEPICLGEKEMPRFLDSPALAHLERNLFRSGRVNVYRQKEGEDGVSLHSSTNPMQEAHFAARTIRRLVQEGRRYQEIAVIVGDTGVYANYLPRIFAQYEIPFFMDNTRTVFTNPMIEFLRAVLEMVRQDFSRASVFRYLRTGLCRLERAQVDLLENYALACGVRGFSKWKKPFTGEPAGFAPEELTLCEELREAWMTPLLECAGTLRSKKTTAREKTEKLYGLLCHYEVQQQLAAYEERFRADGEAELCREYAQVYGAVMGLFDKIVELLGEECLELKEYAELLESGFEELKIGIIPPTADRVQVGDMERTRLHDVSVLLFLGLNDGWVPSGGSGGGLISDMEREFLKSSQVELAPTAREDSYIQKFYLYLNLTKPSKRLYLSYCKAACDGSAMRPSYVVRTLQRLFAPLKVHDEDRHTGLRWQTATPKSSLSYLVEGLQKIESGGADREWMELFGWYRRNGEYREQVEKLVEAAFLTFDERGIGKAAARALYGETLVNSVSRLERFASCAFAHFLQYGLHLTERAEYEFHPVDLGNVFHAVMELFSKKVEQSDYNWMNLPQAVRESFVEEAIGEVAAQYGGQILHSSARSEAQLLRMQRILQRTAWALQRQIQAGHFYPANYEVSFSQVEGLEAVNIALSEEEKMKLRGRIDRIDVCEQEKQVYVKVIDYKSGNTSLDLVALYHGLQLQLVVYLNAAMELEQRVHREKEIVPAGIFYYHMEDPMLEGSGGESAQEVNQRLLRELRVNGLVNADPEVFREMDAAFTKNSDVIPVMLNKDGTPSRLSKTASTEQFDELSAFVRQKMQEIGQRMLSGEIAPVPYERKQRTGCDYCVYREVCRLDGKIPGTRVHRLQEYSQDEVWQKIKEELDGKKE